MFLHACFKFKNLDIISLTPDTGKLTTVPKAVPEIKLYIRDVVLCCLNVKNLHIMYTCIIIQQ